MNRYSATYFDHGIWRHCEVELLAESIDQVNTYIDNECKPEYRGRPYHQEYEDSLVIKVLEEGCALPYILREY